MKILVAIEAFAGISYMLYLLQFQVIDWFTALPLIMAIISFGIAYGLYRLKRPAWFLSMAFSLFGLIFGGLGFIIMINAESVLLDLPKLILDLMTILLLLSKDVRKAFRIRTG
ncbi:MAG: hypothetical protein H5T33_01965 [Candidatus Methanosuratus sp.]|nr:hypothetical protein [Candidatus Methanosuratincola sp.]